MLGLRRCHASNSSLPHPEHSFIRSARPPLAGRACFTFARNAVSYSRPTVPQFTQETAEPLGTWTEITIPRRCTKGCPQTTFQPGKPLHQGLDGFHFLASQANSLAVGIADQFHVWVFAFPGHCFHETECGFDFVENFPVPVVLQDAQQRSTGLYLL